jgi:hypothetical protein
MEDQNKENLFERMSAQNAGIEPPPLSRLQAARQAVEGRRAAPEKEDIIMLLAGFLNMKIKLYHAVLASIVIGGLILYFSRDDGSQNNEAAGSGFANSLAAVANQTVHSVTNSTVLSSINTFVIRK